MSLAAAIVPTEDKLQKLKKVKLAGFAFVARTTNWYARIFWILLIILAFAFLIYEVYRTIVDFIENPVITTYVLNPHDEMPLPKIFICPSIIVKAAYHRSNSRKTTTLVTALNSLQSLGSSSADPRGEFQFDPAAVKSKTDGGNGNTNDTSAFRDEVFKMGFTVDEFFLMCRFYGNGSEWDDVPCSNIVTSLFDHRYGKCFQLNVERNQTNDGKALSLIINSMSKSNSLNDTLLIKPYEGIYVTVDSHFQPASHDKNLVTAGSYTKMALSITHLELLNLLSGALIQPCAEEEAAKLKILNSRYTLSNCKFECILSEAQNSCSCYPTLDPSVVLPEILNSSQFCTLDQYKTCLIGRISVSNDSKSRIDECQNQCQSPCDDNRYDVSTSSAPLNPTAFEDTAKEIGAKVEELLLLDIAFSRLETIVFTQTSSMTFDFFVGNLCSQITLWIGGCMLTLLPLPLSFSAFCITACVIKARGGCKRKGEND